MTAKKSFFIRENISESKKIQKRQETLTSVSGVGLDASTHFPFDVETVGKKNCENLVGTVGLPVGVAGPVPMQVSYSETLTEYPQVVLPLATTEGALVASINRGASCVAAAGGATVSVKKVGMSRAPVFVCKNSAAATSFTTWIKKSEQLFEEAATKTSSHLHFVSATTYVQGTYVFVRAVFDTDEAMGMNMVSIALDYWWQQLVPDEIKTDIEMLALSGNVCADKKPAQITRELGRGYWVEAKVTLPEKLVIEKLGLKPSRLVEVHHAKNVVGSEVAGIKSGNMHVANAVAAMFIATGQDPAHVVDVAGTAVVSFLLQPDNSVEVLLTMPSVPVGTVGGGTALPQQSEWQQVLFGKKPQAFELAAAVALAALSGELSGLAALATHTLASAHAKLGRSAK